MMPSVEYPLKGGEMSDARLRELERRFGQSGALDDEVLLICERLRVGDISPQALAVAADLIQYPAAQLALGDEHVARQAPTAQRWETELHAIPFTDGEGMVRPLGMLAAAVLATEAAWLYESNTQAVGHVERLIKSVRNIMFRMRGSRKHHVHLLSEWDRTDAGQVRIAWCGGGLDDVEPGDLLRALMTFTVQYVHSREADLAFIIGVFLCRVPIFGFSQQIRHRWFQTAMMHALIPHLIGHPSTIPHPPHLSDVAPQ